MSNILDLFKGQQATLSGDQQDTLAKVELDELRAQARESEDKVTQAEAELEKITARTEKAEAALAELEKRPKASTPEEVAEVMAQERVRLVEISKLAMVHGASKALLDEGIFSGMSKDAFAIALLEEQVAQRG